MCGELAYAFIALEIAAFSRKKRTTKRFWHVIFNMLQKYAMFSRNTSLLDRQVSSLLSVKNQQRSSCFSVILHPLLA